MSARQNHLSVSSTALDAGFSQPAEPSLAMGVIGNCAFSALIDKRGRIVWCCLPRFGGDPVFNTWLEPGKAGPAGAQAREIFATMLSARNHVGLLSEDTHPVTGEMWGSFPQTYSMVGIINAAVRLSAP